MENKHINRAIKEAGGQKSLAELIGVSQAAVSKWRLGKKITAENAVSVEKATNGKVTRKDLRPDVFA